MENILLDKNVRDNLCNSQYIGITWLVKNYSFVRKGDLLGCVSYTAIEEKKRLFSNQLQPKDSKYEIVSPSEGYLYIYDEYNLDWDEDESVYVNIHYWTNNVGKENGDIETINNALAGIFKSPKEIFLHYYSCKGSKVKTDPFTKSTFIKWSNLRRLPIAFGDYLSIDFIEGKAVLRYDTKETIQKGDCFSLLFEDGQLLDYIVASNPTKDDSYHVAFTLYQEDVDLLLNEALTSYRITYNKTAKRPDTIDLQNFCWNHQYKEEAIHTYIKTRIETIKKLVPDYQLPYRLVRENPIDYKFNWCYVYLMKDISNGYYKIGISNTPEYREKTLQSEKPTIELLASKKYPTRKIAEAIESALHTAYSQQRLRGEWFNLNDTDVAAIIETLK